MPQSETSPRRSQKRKHGASTRRHPTRGSTRSQTEETPSSARRGARATSALASSAVLRTSPKGPSTQRTGPRRPSPRRHTEQPSRATPAQGNPCPGKPACSSEKPRVARSPSSRHLQSKAQERNSQENVAAPAAGQRFTEAPAQGHLPRNYRSVPGQEPSRPPHRASAQRVSDTSPLTPPTPGGLERDILCA